MAPSSYVASPVSTENNTLTPIGIAAMLGNLEVVQVLVHAGANINTAHIPENAAPLHFSVFANHQSVTQFLLDSGADKKTVDKHGQTALDVAQLEGHNEIVSMLS